MDYKNKWSILKQEICNMKLYFEVEDPSWKTASAKACVCEEILEKMKYIEKDKNNETRRNNKEEFEALFEILLRK